MKTVRDELAVRLNVYRKMYRKIPVSFNQLLGIGKPLKEKDKPFDGFSIDGFRYRKGIK